MAKRFSVREFGLLMAPVLVVGAAGVWVSTRPPAEYGRPHLSFHLEAPTALEAFRGANVSCVVTIENLSPFDGGTDQISPYVELKTSQGVEVGKQYGNYNRVWNRNLWNYTSRGPNFTRFLLKTKDVPAGEMRFGVLAVVPPNIGNVPPSSPDLRTKPLHLSGEWPVNRAGIKPFSLASWPRHSQVSVRSVKITSVAISKTRAGGPSTATCEITFDLLGASMDEQIRFDYEFHEHHFVPRNHVQYGLSWGSNTAPETPHTRVRQWTVNTDSPTTKLNISGRASADNLWPLGFQIEPFSLQTAKVGQKLRFKQAPIALPKI